MHIIFIWIILFCIATVTSITLTGSRSLIEGNLTVSKVIDIIFDWRFIVAVAFAFVARLLFIFINNALLKIPHLAASSTTITTLITSVALIFVLFANYYFLGERMTLTQILGAAIIICGIVVITR